MDHRASRHARAGAASSGEEVRLSSGTAAWRGVSLVVGATSSRDRRAGAVEWATAGSTPRQGRIVAALIVYGEARPSDGGHTKIGRLFPTEAKVVAPHAPCLRDPPASGGSRAPKDQNSLSCGSGFQPRSNIWRPDGLLCKATPRRGRAMNVAGARGRGSGISFFPYASRPKPCTLAKLVVVRPKNFRHFRSL